MKNKNLRKIGTIIVILFGNMLYALAVKLFLVPGNLITGGTTGLGLLTQRLTGIPLSGFVLLFNLIMLAAGFFLLGKKFAFTTVISSFAYPAALEVFNRILGDTALTGEPMLNTVFAGIGIGLAMGIVIRTGASTGGMDIPPLLLKKYFRVPVFVSLNIFDLLILAGQAVFNPTDQILYGIILVFIYTFVLDKVIMMGMTRTEVKIISEQTEKIRQAILMQIDRGVTMLQGESGYLHQEMQVALCIVANRELPRLERLVRDIDPEAFIIVSRVTEVWGKGFSVSKNYISKQ